MAKKKKAAATGRIERPRRGTASYQRTQSVQAKRTNREIEKAVARGAALREAIEEKVRRRLSETPKRGHP